MARLALFALFAVALVLLRDALSERWHAGEDRARALFQEKSGEKSDAAPAEPVPAEVVP